MSPKAWINATIISLALWAGILGTVYVLLY